MRAGLSACPSYAVPRVSLHVFAGVVRAGFSLHGAKAQDRCMFHVVPVVCASSCLVRRVV